jgi:ankyrin repeat protein
MFLSWAGWGVYSLGVSLKHGFAQYSLGQQLISAALDGDMTTVKSLVEQGAPVNFSDNWTALEKAAEHGDVPMTKFLIARGATVYPHMLIFAGNVPVAKVLMAHGAQVNAKDYNGTTPLMSAGFNNRELTAFLIKHGADVNARDAEGKTVLRQINEFVAFGNNYDRHTIQLLKKAGAHE